MADVFSNESRSYVMSQIKSKNTKLEQIVRKYLFSNGFRYRINNKHIPGHPDIILPKYNTVIFVNGCFWHMHENCSIFSMPKSNQEYWVPKLTGNKNRDVKNISRLKEMGWHVIVVWECELKKKIVRDERLKMLVKELNDNFYNDLINRLDNL